MLSLSKFLPKIHLLNSTESTYLLNERLLMVQGLSGERERLLRTPRALLRHDRQAAQAHQMIADSIKSDDTLCKPTASYYVKRFQCGIRVIT